MLYTEAVEKGTLDIIKKLMTDGVFDAFNLVGGTTLAIKVGHRKSIDIDLFTTSDFNAQEISKHLITVYNATRVQIITNGVFCFINGVKLDLLAHKYPLIENLEIIDDIRMVSLKDIGAMKLNAIYYNGTRLKDFVDMYALLEIFSLHELIGASERKYPEINTAILKQALLHHKDIDFSVRIDYVGADLKWPEIAGRLTRQSCRLCL
jgi:Nucleotidyl transferase AbiEii toxin, Type IV TA system